jgi:hypothetical protein
MGVPAVFPLYYQRTRRPGGGRCGGTQRPAGRRKRFPCTFAKRPLTAHGYDRWGISPTVDCKLICIQPTSGFWQNEPKMGDFSRPANGLAIFRATSRVEDRGRPPLPSGWRRSRPLFTTTPRSGEAAQGAPPLASQETAQATAEGGFRNEAADAAHPRTAAAEVEVKVYGVTERINWIAWLTGTERYPWLAVMKAAEKEFKQTFSELAVTDDAVLPARHVAGFIRGGFQALV